jgi:hypothetical protein
VRANAPGSAAWLKGQRRAFQRCQLEEERQKFELLLASQSGHFYRLIDDADVDVDKRLAVGFCLPLIAQHLEIAPPSLSWFKAAAGHEWLVAQREARGGFFKSAGAIAGRARRGVVALNAGAPLSNIVATLAHEVAHCRQLTLADFAERNRDRLEADADTYSRRWATAGRFLCLAISGLPRGKEGQQ